MSPIDAGHQPRTRRFALDPAFGPVMPLPIVPAGTILDIVKLDPAGRHVVTYPGRVLPDPGHPDWLVAEARWVNRPVRQGDLTFQTGDRLIESFSASHPWNGFAVHHPDTGELRGWYANVTFPARVEPGAERPRLIWRDLFLDVVGTPGGTILLLDEDELAASGLAETDPQLHRAIVAAAGVVRARMAAGVFPFGAIRS